MSQKTCRELPAEAPAAVDCCNIIHFKLTAALRQQTLR